MMRMNSRLYQYFIILLALGNPSFVFASDDSIASKKEQAEMPAAPAGPYRSQTEKNISKDNNKINHVHQLMQPMPAPQLVQRPPQQQMRPPVAPPAWVNNARPQQRIAPNWNRNITPQSQQRPPQQIRPPVAPPAWVNKVPPQPRMVPSWNRNLPPQAQSNQHRSQQQMHPPIAPPVWVNKAPPQRMAPNWNRNVPPQAQWVQPKVPDWVKNPPRGPKPPKWVTNPPAPPAWVNNFPRQRMQAPKVPEWVKNPPYGPKPPAWAINPPQQPMYPYGNRGRN